MQKRHLFTIINLSALVFVALLWVIDVAAPTALPFFNFAWAAFLLTAIWGVSFTVRVFVEKQTIMKKSWTILATVFYVTAAVSLISALALPGKLVLPILCFAAATAVLIGSLVLGGKKWDEGDNQKPGYKNYYERKAEAEVQKTAEAEAQATETKDESAE